MIVRLAGCLAFAALSLSASVTHARPRLASTQLQELQHYSVLVFSDPHRDGLERGKAIGVIDATPEEVFRVATDYAKLQEFMPRIAKSRIVQRGQSETDVELLAQLPFAGNTAFIARYTHDKMKGDIYRVRFDLVSGSMKQYFGSLYIEPWGDGKTAITYELLAEPRVLVTDGTINWGIRRSCGKFVHALRQRINDLHRLGFLHPQPLRTPTSPPFKERTGDTLSSATR